MNSPSISQSICGPLSSSQFQLFTSPNPQLIQLDFDFTTCFKSFLSILFSILFCLVLFGGYYHQDKLSNVTVQKWLLAKNTTVTATRKSLAAGDNVKMSAKKVRVNVEFLDTASEKDMSEEMQGNVVEPYLIGFIHAARVALAAILTILNLVLFFFIFMFPKDTVGFFETISPQLLVVYGIPSPSAATLSYSVMMCAVSLISLFLAACRIGDLVCFTLCSGWIGLAILDGIRFRSFIYYSIRFPTLTSPTILTLFGVLLFTQILFIVLCGFPIENWRGLKRGTNDSPELYSHFFARVFFTWVWRFVYMGSKKPLEMEDVYDLNPRMTSAFLIKKFAKAWKVQSRKAKETESTSWFLVKVLFNSFGWEYLSAGLIRIVIIILTYLSPILMNLLLQYLQTQTPPPPDVPLDRIPPRQDLNTGGSIVGAMVLIMVLNVGLGAMFTWLCDMATYKARSALMNRVFRKALRLKNPMDPGEVINRFTGDTEAVTGAFAYLHLLWSAPIEIAVCLYLLYGILGPSSFAALGTSIIIGLSSVLVVPIVVRKTKKMLIMNDERMNLVAGTFSNIQTIKLYGWERVFGKKIARKREAQLDKLGNILVVTSIIGGVMSSAVNLIVLSTLALYALTAPSDRPLDLARIFVGMSLLSTLQTPLNTLSGFYSQLMKLGVSYDRLSSLLCAEEVVVKKKGASTASSETKKEKRKSQARKSRIGIDEKVVVDDMEDMKKMGAAILIRDASFAIEMPFMNPMLGGPGPPMPPPSGPMSYPPPPDMPMPPHGSEKRKKGRKVVQEEQMEEMPMHMHPMHPPPPPMNVVLSDINVHVPAGALTAIIGPTGCGKSSLLNVMGSCHTFNVKPSSRVVSLGSTASVSQQPWIFSGTVRENILFYNQFEPKWYSKIISSCCLDYDLEGMKGKDMAFLSNGGDSLSGGQKQRVALARAVYSHSDIYLFDDPFSAVDARVSAHIFKNVMGPDGLLKSKTRVLATNRIDFLPKCDHVIVMEEGRVIAQGSFKEITTSGSQRVKQMIESIGSTIEGMTDPPPPLLDDDNNDGVENDQLRKKILDFKSYQFLNSPSTQNSTNRRALNKASSHGSLLRPASNAILDMQDDRSDIINMEESRKNRIVQEEMHHRGKLPYNLYWYYLRSCSFFFSCIVLILLLSNLGLGSWNEFWLQAWGQSNINSIDSVSKNMFYLGIFTAGTIGTTILSITMDLVAIRVMALNASRHLHHEALISTLSSPITFFHANPAGRIINRFSNDILDLDQTIPSNLLSLMNALLSALLSIGLACIASYYVAIIAAVMIVLYGVILVFFMKSVRELRRLVLISQSPTFTYLKESLEGVSSIRAFGKEVQCEEQMQQLIDTNSKVFYSTFAASSWLSTMIQFLSLMMVIPVLFFSVFTGGFINAGFIAIALTNALSIGSTLQGIVQSYIAMEISLVSIERIKEYIDLPGEVESRSLLALPMPDEAWPSRGEIQFKNFSTGYRVDDPDECVLKNINLTIKAGSRVAVIGRTGSGKSTLVLSLFQLLQAKAGSIHIDGTDLASIDLATIRKRMAIIPQHSMIFPGTVRENLDPTKKASEKDLWRALKMVGLDGVVKMLTAPMQENGKDVEERMNPLDCRIPGDRLSSGEKQLFCFCRAILKKSQVVLLDEPTANIDVESDQRIQEMIRQVFSGSTVITIAHRLSTILDYDMVICLEGGRVVEYRNPQELLKDPKSMFYALYQASLAN